MLFDNNEFSMILGFVELPGLTTEDHVTLALVEHYMDFKVCSQLLS